MEEARKSFESACITSARVATNCPMGGDAGHGGVTELDIIDGGGTCMEVFVVTSERTYSLDDVRRIDIRLLGDCECVNLRRILAWASLNLDRICEANEKANG